MGLWDNIREAIKNESVPDPVAHNRNQFPNSRIVEQKTQDIQKAQLAALEERQRADGIKRSNDRKRLTDEIRKSFFHNKIEQLPGPIPTFFTQFSYPQIGEAYFNSETLTSIASDLCRESDWEEITITAEHSGYTKPVKEGEVRVTVKMRKRTTIVEPPYSPNGIKPDVAKKHLDTVYKKLIPRHVSEAQREIDIRNKFVDEALRAYRILCSDLSRFTAAVQSYEHDRFVNICINFASYWPDLISDTTLEILREELMKNNPEWADIKLLKMRGPRHDEINSSTDLYITLVFDWKDNPALKDYHFQVDGRVRGRIIINGIEYKSRYFRYLGEPGQEEIAYSLLRKALEKDDANFEVFTIYTEDEDAFVVSEVREWEALNQ